MTDEPFTRKDIITLQVSLCLFLMYLFSQSVNLRVIICFLQDPTNLDKFNVSSFFHVKNDLKLLDPGEVLKWSLTHLALSMGTPNKLPSPCCLDEEKAKLDPAYHLKSTNMETRETLAELYRDYKGDQLLASTSKEPEAKKTDKLNAVSEHTIMIMQL